jgi:hypothetical protein
VKARLTLLLHRIGAEAASLGTWWLEELRSIGSGFVDVLSRRRNSRFLVRIGTREAQFFALRGQTLTPRGSVPIDPTTGHWPETIPIPGIPARSRVLAALGPEVALEDRLTLPKGAVGEVDRILQLHLERHFPLVPDAIYSARELMKGPPGTQIVRYWVARRDRVTDVEKALRRWGLEPERLGPESRAGRIVGNWLPGRPSSGAALLGRWDRRLIQSATALAVLVGVILVGQVAWARFLVGRELSRAERASQSVSATLHRYQQGLAPFQALAALARQPDAADALLALSERVPNDAWIYDAESRATSSGAPTVKLTGFAPSAATLAQRLEESIEFEGVETVGVIPRGGPSGFDRVQLTMHWQAARAAKPATPAGSDSAAVVRARP